MHPGCYPISKTCLFIGPSLDDSSSSLHSARYQYVPHPERQKLWQRPVLRDIPYPPTIPSWCNSVIIYDCCYRVLITKTASPSMLPSLTYLSMCSGTGRRLTCISSSPPSRRPSLFLYAISHLISITFRWQVYFISFQSKYSVLCQKGESLPGLTLCRWYVFSTWSSVGSAIFISPSLNLN